MTDDREPFREAAERCSNCGSNRFVAVSLDRGTSRRAQCIPCGHIEPAALPRDWTSPHRRSDDRAEMQAARTAGLQKRHEQRLENATYTAAEVKALGEVATKVAYALGRKDAGEEIAVAVLEMLGSPAGPVAAYTARRIASEPPADAGGYSDLPQDSQAGRSPQERCPLADLDNRCIQWGEPS